MNPGLPGPSAQTPIWEEPVRGFYTDPGQFVTLSGLDLLRSMLEGGLGPPIGYLFGLGLAAVEPGGVTFTMPVTDWLLFSQGVVSGATLGILVDAPLGCTVQTALPPATPFTTAEISLRFLRTVVPHSGTLTAAGRLIHAGQTTGVSLVEVTDEAEPPGRGDEHPVRDPAARGRAVGGHRAGAEEPAPAVGAGLAVAPSVRAAGGR